MKAAVSDDGIKKIIEIYFEGRNISKCLTHYEYSGLRNFLSKNTKNWDFEKISNERLMKALSSLGVEVKPTLHVNLEGEDGNIFVVVGRAAEILKRLGKQDEANEMKNRVIKQKSYEGALEVINEYVEIRQIVGF